jgi:hypothetical protein
MPPGNWQPMLGKWRIAVLAVTGIIAIGAYFARDQIVLVRIGTAFAAKQTCSCLLVSRRSPESCMKDYDPEVANRFSWHVGDRRVTVSALGIFSSTAVFDDGFGCHVEH